MPIYAVTILYQLNHLDVPISSDNAAAGVTGVPPVIDTGVIIVDRATTRTSCGSSLDIQSILRMAIGENVLGD